MHARNTAFVIQITSTAESGNAVNKQGGTDNKIYL